MYGLKFLFFRVCVVDVHSGWDVIIGLWNFPTVFDQYTIIWFQFVLHLCSWWWQSFLQYMAHKTRSMVRAEDWGNSPAWDESVGSAFATTLASCLAVGKHSSYLLIKALVHQTFVLIMGSFGGHMLPVTWAESWCCTLIYIIWAFPLFWGPTDSTGPYCMQLHCLHFLEVC